MILETDGNKHLAHLSLSLFKSHLSLSKCHPPTWPENSFIVQRSHLTKTQKDEAKKTKQNRTQQILNWVWLAKYWNPDTDRYIIYNIYIFFISMWKFVQIIWEGGPQECVTACATDWFTSGKHLHLRRRRIKNCFYVCWITLSNVLTTAPQRSELLFVSE